MGMVMTIDVEVTVTSVAIIILTCPSSTSCTNFKYVLFRNCQATQGIPQPIFTQEVDIEV
jgi:hypothetical protein